MCRYQDCRLVLKIISLMLGLKKILCLCHRYLRLSVEFSEDIADIEILKILQIFKILQRY